MSSSILIAFTYGFGIPLLIPIVGFVILFHQIIDAILITYWYKPVQIETSRMN